MFRVVCNCIKVLYLKVQMFTSPLAKKRLLRAGKSAPRMKPNEHRMFYIQGGLRIIMVFPLFLDLAFSTDMKNAGPDMHPFNTHF